MGFKRLEKNLIDIIKEEQAKLGFRKEEIRLYYPLISLNHFFEADDDVDEMQTRLEQFPEEVKKKIAQQIEELNIKEPQNLEEQALSLVGRDVYEKLIRGYTEKQWGRDCKDLPAFIIKRIPLRFTYNNNYFILIITTL